MHACASPAAWFTKGFSELLRNNRLIHLIKSTVPYCVTNQGLEFYSRSIQWTGWVTDHGAVVNKSKCIIYVCQDVFGSVSVQGLLLQCSGHTPWGWHIIPASLSSRRLSFHISSQHPSSSWPTSFARRLACSFSLLTGRISHMGEDMESEALGRMQSSWDWWWIKCSVTWFIILVKHFLHVLRHTLYRLIHFQNKNLMVQVARYSEHTKLHWFLRSNTLTSKKRWAYQT